ncbi:MAG: ice-binding family protein [Gammaproteobacteria bacterium]|nr:ice-binding family protein [Gammaproteobacteria bacterium]
MGSRTAVFTPENELESGTTYTATVESGVTDLAGNRLAGNQGPITDPNDYIWTFTTDVALAGNNISVLSTNPGDGGTLSTCPASSINATFEVPSGLRLDPATVTSLTFQVVEDATPSNIVIAESVVLDVDTGTIVTFTPQAELTEGVTYRATLLSGPEGVKDLAVPGNEMLEDFVWTFTAVAPVEPCVEQPFPLNAAAPFGSFGGSAGVTNQGLLTIINGDIGTTGTSTLVTGFVSEPDCTYTVTPLNEGQVNGKIFTAPPPPTVQCPQDGTAETEAIATQARSDANDAFIALSPAALPGGQTPSGDGENLGGQTLAPGIYQAPGGAFLIEGGDLTLDGQGDQNALWVFQMASTLTVGEAAVPRSVILINGAQAKNVFWQVCSSATINPSGGGNMKGTIIAESGVSFSTAGNVDIVTLDGRALSLTSSVTMVNTVVNVPAP